jgi:hypothetical protein
MVTGPHVVAQYLLILLVEDGLGTAEQGSASCRFTTANLAKTVPSEQHMLEETLAPVSTPL